MSREMEVLDNLDTYVWENTLPWNTSFISLIQWFEKNDAVMHNADERTNFWTTVHWLTTYIANFAYFQHLRVECFSIRTLV